VARQKTFKKQYRTYGSMHTQHSTGSCRLRPKTPCPFFFFFFFFFSPPFARANSSTPHVGWHDARRRRARAYPGVPRAARVVVRDTDRRRVSARRRRGCGGGGHRCPAAVVPRHARRPAIALGRRCSASSGFAKVRAPVLHGKSLAIFCCACLENKIKKWCRELRNTVSNRRARLFFFFFFFFFLR
jgi:hypothetical protein